MKPIKWEESVFRITHNTVDTEETEIKFSQACYEFLSWSFIFSADCIHTTPQHIPVTNQNSKNNNPSLGTQ